MINNLQALRFFAALFVVVIHTQHELVEIHRFDAPWNPVNWGLGVDVFFVISGIVMFLTAAKGFGKPGAPREFILKRIARVAPLYWIFTTLTLAAALLVPSQMSHPNTSIAHIVSSYLFIPYVRHDVGVYPVLSLGWTLNHEMFFYAIFGVCLFLPLRIGMAVMVAILVAISALNPFVPPEWVQLQYWSRPIILEFTAGLGLGALYKTGFRINGLLAIAIVIAAVLIAPAEPTIRWIEAGIPAAFIAAAMLMSPQMDNQGGLQKALILGGNASYALYLSHPFTIAIALAIYKRVPVVPAQLTASLILIAAVIGSVVVYVLIDRPIEKFLKTRSRSVPQGSRRPWREDGDHDLTSSEERRRGL